ncbi:MAG: transcription termination factor NusA [Chloroflexi bacterium]|nr:transcription termination factor NusA [Chloroflexota bacterium]MCL5075416.1 transcription termination factor NusA [Chloroflexota bacterium]
MKSDFIAAINQVCSEKGLSKDIVLRALEAALVSAYKRNFGSGGNQGVEVKVDPQSGMVMVYRHKRVVEEVKDDRSEIHLTEARNLKEDVGIGDIIAVESTPQNFGRIAAQTAKQVILQRLREAEREMIYEEYADREGDIITGVVSRIEGKTVVIDLGKIEAVLPVTEQVSMETHRIGQRLKVLIVEVQRSNKGPQLVVSRSHRGLLKRLFELEVPEVYNGVVEIKSIAREPGARSKVAVVARQEGIDPIGSCVGPRGVRIQNIVSELNGEKIDVVQWHENPSTFVANALSPAQVISVDINEADKTATVIVPDRQLSLAIGKEGQNARLAARLTGWRIDIKSASPDQLAGKSEKGETSVDELPVAPVEIGEGDG